MDYFDDDKLCSVNEFYQNFKKLKKELGKNGVVTDEEINNKKALLLRSSRRISRRFTCGYYGGNGIYRCCSLLYGTARRWRKVIR